MKRPNLAYVVNSLNAGGTERLVVDMSLAFSSEYEVAVFCLDEPGIWAPRLRSQGIDVHCLWRQPGLDLAVAGRLARQFRSLGTQIVHAHQCTPWFYSALSRLVYGGPRLLLEEHGRFYPEVANSTRAFINRRLIRKLTHRFIAVSADIRGRLVRYEGLDPGQIEVIYNGVAAPPRASAEERACMRSQLGIKPDEFVVGTVGRFDPIKNLPLLVNSIAAARRQDSGIRGLLVGDGPEFSHVNVLLEELGLGEVIKLTGYRGDARTLVQCMDLFVLSSLSEGTSMALLEAMAAEVPVAVTAVGGNPEIVLDGTTGWVVPSGGVSELTQAICEARADNAKRLRFAQAGRERFAASFEFSQMIGAYRHQYQQLLAR